MLRAHRGDLACFALKVQHHGWGGACSEDFLDAAGPRIAVISTGPSAYPEPEPRLLSLFQEKNVKVFRTDRDGTVRIRTDGASVEVSGGPQSALFSMHAGRLSAN